jgi:hypothetical protein
VATGDFKEISEISGDFSRYFVQESDEQLQRTLGTEVFQGEFTIDENLTAFDTSPIFQRTDTPNEYKPEPPEPATTVKRISGANWYVYNGLKNITFVPGTACQMSQVIAYIRYWSRGGTADKTPVETEEQPSAPTDPQQKLEEDVSQVSSPGTTNPTPQTTQPSTRTILTVPENRATGRRQPVPTQVPVTGSQPSPRSGKIVSANPSGTVNTAGVTASPPPTDAVWMFLFNPEELQLSSGPDYNRAETWGVSDPNNSGQPLSWRANRNRKLSFGKVLLHGYTFGKRVDTLEAGLQQLFMARDGENGSDGPPVLEFVWGKRVFGPCVIQNIQVREKAWDKGILVNAEVSFELEQVPEWTINDGYVDILRPGRQPLVNDPLLPRSILDSSTTKEPKDTPGGGNSRPINVSYCTELYQVRKTINDREFELKMLKKKPLRVSTQRGPDQGLPLSNKDIIRDLLEYWIWGGLDTRNYLGYDPPGKPNFVDISEEVKEVNSKIRQLRNSSECQYKTYEQAYNYSINQAYTSGSDVPKKIKNIDNYYTDIVLKCIRSYKNILNDSIGKEKCSSSPYRTPTGKVNGRPVQGPGLF